MNVRETPQEQMHEIDILYALGTLLAILGHSQPYLCFWRMWFSRQPLLFYTKISHLSNADSWILSWEREDKECCV